MGAKGAVEIIFRGRKPDEQANEVASYEKLFANPLTAARRGYIDDVIEPKVTRHRLCQVNPPSIIIIIAMPGDPSEVPPPLGSAR